MNDDAALNPFLRSTLGALADVNLQALQLMLGFIESDRVPRGFAVLGEIAPDLVRLDRDGIRRLAAMPHLLVDLNFRDVDWWRGTRYESLRAVAIADRLTRLARPRLLALSRATITLVWHVVRIDQAEAALLLGLSEDVARELSQWSPDDVQRVAERQALRIRPRWSNRPHVWQQWIEAASSDDAEAMRRMRVHGLQLLGSDARRAAS